MDFKDSRTNLYGFKNEKGKVIVSPMYSNVKFNPDYGTWDVQKDSLFGFYSREGKLILNPAYKFIELNQNLYQSFIVVSKDKNKFGLMDLNGSKILDLKYPKILDFRKNLLLVCEYNGDNVINKVIIDTAQNTILDSKVIHAEVYGFVEDNPEKDTVIFIQAIKNDKIAVFAGNGRQISEFVFDGLCRSRGRLIQGCMAHNSRQCGIIDENNKVIIPFIYIFAGVFDSGTIRADTEKDEHFYFNSEGKLISEKEFKKENVNHPYWGND